MAFGLTSFKRLFASARRVVPMLALGLSAFAFKADAKAGDGDGKSKMIVGEMTEQEYNAFIAKGKAHQDSLKASTRTAAVYRNNVETRKSGMTVTSQEPVAASRPVVNVTAQPKARVLASAVKNSGIKQVRPVAHVVNKTDSVKTPVTKNNHLVKNLKNTAEKQKTRLAQVKKPTAKAPAKIIEQHIDSKGKVETTRVLVRNDKGGFDLVPRYGATPVNKIEYVHVREHVNPRTGKVVSRDTLEHRIDNVDMKIIHRTNAYATKDHPAAERVAFVQASNTDYNTIDARASKTPTSRTADERKAAAPTVEEKVTAPAPVIAGNSTRGWFTTNTMDMGVAGTQKPVKIQYSYAPSR